MHQLTSTTGIVAMAGAAVAIVALAWGVWLSLALRRLRAAQRMVLGDHNVDLVAHAAALEREYRALHDDVEDRLARVDARVTHAEQRLDGAVAYRSLVR